jgi:hypothetical protein
MAAVFLARKPKTIVSPLFEIAAVVVRFNHVASFIVNANQGGFDRL